MKPTFVKLETVTPLEDALKTFINLNSSLSSQLKFATKEDQPLVVQQAMTLLETLTPRPYSTKDEIKELKQRLTVLEQANEAKAAPELCEIEDGVWYFEEYDYISFLVKYSKESCLYWCSKDKKWTLYKGDNGDEPTTRRRATDDDFKVVTKQMEGKYYYVKTTRDNAHIFLAGKSNKIGLTSCVKSRAIEGNNIYGANIVCYNDEILDLRLATESEINLLKQAK